MQLHAISKFMARPLFKGEAPDCEKCPDCPGCKPETAPKAPVDNKDLPADKFVKTEKPQ